MEAHEGFRGNGSVKPSTGSPGHARPVTTSIGDSGRSSSSCFLLHRVPMFLMLRALKPRA